MIDHDSRIVALNNQILYFDDFYISTTFALTEQKEKNENISVFSNLFVHFPYRTGGRYAENRVGSKCR